MNTLFNNIELKTLPFKMLVFYEVVRKSSFTQAAETLHLTKSGVSQHVSQLEQELKTQLITRTTRKFTLTESGRLFFKKCEDLHQVLSQALIELQNFHQRPKGLIKLTAPHALLHSTIAPAISHLTDEFPELTPQIILDDKPIDLISDNIDLAIRVGTLSNSQLKAKKLGSLHDIFVVSPQYLTQHSSFSTIQDFVNHSLIRTSWQQNNKLDFIDTTTQEKISISLNSNYYVNSVNAAAELVMSNCGIALLPNCFVKPLLLKGELRQIFPNLQTPSETIWSVHPYQTDTPLKVTRLIELIKDELNTQDE